MKQTKNHFSQWHKVKTFHASIFFLDGGGGWGWGNYNAGVSQPPSPNTPLKQQRVEAKRRQLTMAFEHTGRDHYGGQRGTCIGLLGGRDGGAVLNGVVRVRAAARNACRADTVRCPQQAKTSHVVKASQQEQPPEGRLSQECTTIHAPKLRYVCRSLSMPVSFMHWSFRTV